MQDCYEVRDGKELEEYLNNVGKAFLDFDYQLQTNHGFVYELNDGKVVFLASNPVDQGILFRDRDCFQQAIDSDTLPIENPEKDLLELEMERVRTINKQVDYYQNHLNEILKFDFSELTRESVEAYLKKVIGRKIKKLTTPKDAVALVAVIGETLRREIKGKWVLEKRYGQYNPFYEPQLINSNRRLILISSYVLGKLKWRTSFLDNLFWKGEGIIDIEELREHRQFLILDD